MKSVGIKDEYITLGQFLKLADVISTGGQAKFFVQEETIHVNGEAENRRGRKLYPEDTVVVEGHGQYKVTRG
ncbi:hypothetical protein SY83_06685 [Paenibacillus swuensis]|uniref:Uncharacterized protein n=1 Tax=Paenibacillus swuensis TaxID=1178515 RepID=A0A172TGV5_9BACL|nr:S4 domain-containing protein YaaA [Paenibacillus swuensis]ANE46023.1 hypothetical protein SY83_06685 [Paenibacillus swuensis]